MMMDNAQRNTVLWVDLSLSNTYTLIALFTHPFLYYVLLYYRRARLEGNSGLPNIDRFTIATLALCTLGARNSTRSESTNLQLAGIRNFGLARSGRSSSSRIV
jgi:hypothetical protein